MHRSLEIIYGPKWLWAEMVMGRFGYGPIWLWAEMTRNRRNVLMVQLITGQLEKVSLERVAGSCFVLLKV